MPGRFPILAEPPERKVKTRPSFPKGGPVMKLLFMILRRISKKRAMPVGCRGKRRTGFQPFTGTGSRYDILLYTKNVMGSAQRLRMLYAAIRTVVWKDGCPANGQPPARFSIKCFKVK
jgi:hypothetical protein